MNLSFAGCGFLGIYHVGVAVCFRKFAPHLLLENISGASAGAISACCMLCELPLGEITSDLLRVVREARSGSLGPFSPSFNVHNVLLEGLEKVLPDDAHLRVSGKLHISLTRVYDGKNVIVSHFKSKEDLVQALLASCFIPVFSGILPPKFHGIRYMDGGFSDNLPILDENTITVSPFCGESDICPRDRSSQLFHVNFANTSIELSKQNMGRFTRILFPPPPEVLSNMCKQGFDDALRFLHRNNLISCTRCLAVQSTFQIQDSFEESMDYDPECLECKHHRQEALVANLPDTVMSVLQTAIDSANKGLYNWIFQHRSMKLLSLLAIPCTLPVDILYATITNVVGKTYEIHGLQYKVVKNFVTVPKVYVEKLSIYQRLISYRSKMNLSIVEIIGAIIQLAQENAWVDENESTHRPPSEQYIPRHSHSNVSRLGKVENAVENTVIDMEATSGDDTFEQILRVTNHHEAIMAYYYMDENNKMKVTEIFDVTDAEIEAFQSESERAANKLLEFDNEWGDDQICDNELEGVSDISIEDVINEKNNILSDPESEWGHQKSLDLFTNNEDSDRPESDQPHSKFISC